MDRITNFYYDAFMLWYEFDPVDGDIPYPYYMIHDSHLRYLSMAIDKPASEVKDFVSAIRNFRQICADEGDDEWVARATDLLETYNELVYRGPDAISADELEMRSLVSKRHQFLYDYYLTRLDSATDLCYELDALGYDYSQYDGGVEDRIVTENVAAELSIHAARVLDSCNYTAEVFECVDRIEDLFEDTASHSVNCESHAMADEMMDVFEKYFGEDLYRYGKVEIENGYGIYECKDDGRVRYDFGRMK